MMSKNNFFLILCFVLKITSSFAQVDFIPHDEEEEYNLKNWKLNGKVKSVEITTYKPRWGTYMMDLNKYKNLSDVPLRDESTYKKYEFDKNGNLIIYSKGEIMYSAVNTPTYGKLIKDTMELINYKYDNANRLILIDDGIGIYSKDYTKYEYDKLGRKIYETSGSGRGIRLENKYEYFENKVTEYLRIRQRDSLFHKNSESIFNSEGDLLDYKKFSTKRIETPINEELQEHWIYNYYSKKRIVIDCYMYMFLKNILKHDTLTFDDNKMLVEKINYIGNIRAVKFKYEYGKNNLLSKEWKYILWGEDEQKYYSVSDNGWLINGFHEYKYDEFDSNSNPTKIYWIQTGYNVSEGKINTQEPIMTEIYKIKYEYY